MNGNYIKQEYKVEKYNKGIKFDDNKPQWQLLYWPFIEEVVKALQLGKNKYGYKNYMKNLSRFRIINALFRHATAMAIGEWYDKESGLSHAAHVAANAMMLFEIEMKELDQYQHSTKFEPEE